ncbi:MAG TPA: outer membrane beta-barrel protein [Spirochaetota bacterium]|nr:outer membrane beta-barrel protein [Spirochaetota bacterium]HOM87340.1 outer membrane beta-barrel protein [Spirochaetota bacterium]HOR94431.1 outer membrane beta-barrel protein [Spirochaetota bacterium]HOT19478.1 outer membrane beta-barrel protein [Spirochaetota bacterium]HPD04551.1 outer membrane beta-barrel protein [Spirochaetota bacterium]
MIFQKNLLKVSCVIVVFISSTLAIAQNNYSNYSFGFSLSGGADDVWHKSGKDDGKDITWNQGIMAGAGLFFENMFTNSFGIHAGINYSYLESELVFQDSTDEKLKSKNHSIIIPLYLLSSFGNTIRIDILYGLSYMHIFHNTMSSNNQHTDGIRYINYNQFGAGLMLRLVFAFNRFTYFYIAPHGQFYFTNVIEDTSWRDYLYTYQLEIGMIFKTF